jgi:hypothetical protein
MEEDSCRRMGYVMAFAISMISHIGNRTRKPFTPLLRETYEFYNHEKKWRFVAGFISNPL